MRHDHPVEYIVQPNLADDCHSLCFVRLALPLVVDLATADTKSNSLRSLSVQPSRHNDQDASRAAQHAWTALCVESVAWSHASALVELYIKVEPLGYQPGSSLGHEVPRPSVLIDTGFN